MMVWYQPCLNKISCYSRCRGNEIILPTILSCNRKDWLMETAVTVEAFKPENVRSLEKPRERWLQSGMKLCIMWITRLYFTTLQHGDNEKKSIWEGWKWNLGFAVHCWMSITFGFFMVFFLCDANQIFVCSCLAWFRALNSLYEDLMKWQWRKLKTGAPTSIKKYRRIQISREKRDSLSYFKELKLIATYQDFPIFQCCVVYCVLSQLITWMIETINL